MNWISWLIAKRNRRATLIHTNFDIYANGRITIGYWVDKVSVGILTSRQFLLYCFYSYSCFRPSRENQGKHVQKLPFLFHTGYNLNFLGKRAISLRIKKKKKISFKRFAFPFFFFFSISVRRTLRRIAAKSRKFHGVYSINL